MEKKGRIKIVYESTNEKTLQEAIENVAKILNNSHSEHKYYVKSERIA